MVAVRTGLGAALAALVALLACLTALLGLGVLGWGVGLVCGAVLAVAVARGSAGEAPRMLGPADVVTLARTTIACAVAGLVSELAAGRSLPPTAGTVVVAVAVVALLLDAVDGRVARATRSVTAFGARFDGEADAFLILVMSVHVAGTYGGWVLMIGLARYAFAAAGWVWPWLRRQLPPRYWRKVVAATQGIVLTVAAARVAPDAVTYAALVVACALLAESFGRDVLWTWCRRTKGTTAAAPVTPAAREAGLPVP